MEAIATNQSLEHAWDPLPAAEWNSEAARHLLQRAAFSATPAAIARTASMPLDVCVAELFKHPPPLPPPPTIRLLDAEAPQAFNRMRAAPPEERKRQRDERRDLERKGYEEFGIAWLQRAADPRHSAGEKFVLFLQDIFVVAFSKVRNPALLHAHQELLRSHGTGSYQALAKAVSRSPAMILYLDLQGSKAGTPNENFARELFELFTLGEGNYTEEDIKQAARAFTGYRQAGGRFQFQRKAHDAGVKRVFGQSGSFDGDAVIDLVFRQPAASSFLPRELIRYYLTDQPVDERIVEALGTRWRADKFNTGVLLRRFFTSRLFFDPAFRGSLIKSPVQFHLGLLQDLGLDVAPLPRFTLGALRQMGQTFYNPPNVRGWVGGRHWINSSTLAARRQLVEFLLSPLNESRLNGDELAALASAKEEGRTRFTIDQAGEFFARLREGGEASLFQTLLEQQPDQDLRRRLQRQLGGAGGDKAAGPRLALFALLQSPHYQLC